MDVIELLHESSLPVLSSREQEKKYKAKQKKLWRYSLFPKIYSYIFLIIFLQKFNGLLFFDGTTTINNNNATKIAKSTNFHSNMNSIAYFI